MVEFTPSEDRRPGVDPRRPHTTLTHPHPMFNSDVSGGVVREEVSYVVECKTLRLRKQEAYKQCGPQHAPAVHHEDVLGADFLFQVAPAERGQEVEGPVDAGHDGDGATLVLQGEQLPAENPGYAAPRHREREYVQGQGHGQEAQVQLRGEEAGEGEQTQREGDHDGEHHQKQLSSCRAWVGLEEGIRGGDEG